MITYFLFRLQRTMLSKVKKQSRSMGKRKLFICISSVMGSIFLLPGTSWAFLQLYLHWQWLKRSVKVNLLFDKPHVVILLKLRHMNFSLFYDFMLRIEDQYIRLRFPTRKERQKLKPIVQQKQLNGCNNNIFVQFWLSKETLVIRNCNLVVQVK